METVVDGFHEVGQIGANTEARYNWSELVADPGWYQYRVLAFRVDGGVETLGPAAVETSEEPKWLQIWARADSPDALLLRIRTRSRGAATIQVFDVQGQLIRSLSPISLLAGMNSISWNGVRESGARAPSGQYWFRVESGDAVTVARGVLVR